MRVAAIFVCPTAAVGTCGQYMWCTLWLDIRQVLQPGMQSLYLDYTLGTIWIKKSVLYIIMQYQYCKIYAEDTILISDFQKRGLNQTGKGLESKCTKGCPLISRRTRRTVFPFTPMETLEYQVLNIQQYYTWCCIIADKTNDQFIIAMLHCIRQLTIAYCTYKCRKLQTY